jgi:hypothetical protein
MRWLIGWFVEQLREINRANAAMRVPEERVRHSGPAGPEALERRPELEEIEELDDWSKWNGCGPVARPHR